MWISPQRFSSISKKANIEQKHQDLNWNYNITAHFFQAFLKQASFNLYQNQCAHHIDELLNSKTSQR